MLCTFKVQIRYGDWVNQLTKPQPMRFHEWVHVCKTRRVESGETAAFVNGSEILRANTAPGYPTKPNGVLILGQEQDDPYGSFEIRQRFVGSISEVHWFNRILNNDESKHLEYVRRYNHHNPRLHLSVLFY